MCSIICVVEMLCCCVGVCVLGWCVCLFVFGLVIGFRCLCENLCFLCDVIYCVFV